MARRLGLLLTALVAAAVAATVTAVALSHPRPRPAALPAGGTGTPANPAASGSSDPGTPLGGRAAPAFALTDQFGRTVALPALRGRVVLLSFVDSRCTTICPLTTSAMLDAQAMLGAAGSDVRLVGIDANPDATAVADVRAYSVAHGMLHRWSFLTGSPRRLAAVWRAYGVYVAASSGAIDHEPVIYLIDATGRERELYLTTMSYVGVRAQALVLARAAARLLAHHPSLVTTAPEALMPTRRATLRGPLGPPQQLGPGHPHLLVFFDTWLAQTGDLANELVALDTYARVAAARGWPSLVAVDEAPVEAGPAALRDLLRRLAGRLDYPVVVDPDGRVADGYGVADQPWFALVSPAGNVLLSNDGWFPAPALQAAAARALH